MPAFYVGKWNLKLFLSKLIELLVIAVRDGIVSTVSAKMSMNNLSVTSVKSSQNVTCDWKKKSCTYLSFYIIYLIWSYVLYVLLSKGDMVWQYLEIYLGVN